MCLEGDFFVNDENKEIEGYAIVFANNKMDEFIPIWYTESYLDSHEYKRYKINQEYKAKNLEEPIFKHKKYYGFHGFFTLEDAMQYSDPEPDLVIVKCKFRHLIATGTQTNLPAFRCLYRTILEVVKIGKRNQHPTYTLQTSTGISSPSFSVAWEKP